MEEKKLIGNLTPIGVIVLFVIVIVATIMIF